MLYYDFGVHWCLGEILFKFYFTVYVRGHIRKAALDMQNWGMFPDLPAEQQNNFGPWKSFYVGLKIP